MSSGSFGMYNGDLGDHPSRGSSKELMSDGDCIQNPNSSQGLRDIESDDDSVARPLTRQPSNRHHTGLEKHFEKDIANLEDKIKSLEQNLADTRKKLNKERDDKEFYKAELEPKDQELGRREKEISAKDRDIKDLGLHIKNLVSDVSDANRRITEEEQKQKILEQKRQELENLLEERQTELQEKIDEQAAGLKKLSETTREAESKTERLKSKLEERESELNETQAQQAQALQEKEALEQEIADLCQETQDSRDEKDQIQAERDVFAKQIEDERRGLEEEIKILKSDRKELQENKQTLQEERDEAQRQLLSANTTDKEQAKELREQLNEREKKLAAMEEVNGELQRRHDELVILKNQTTDEAQSKMQGLQKQLEERTKQLEEQTKQLEEREDKLTKTEQDLQQRQNELEQASSKTTDEARSEMQRLQKQLEEQTKQLEEREDKLAKMEQEKGELQQDRNNFEEALQKITTETIAQKELKIDWLQQENNELKDALKEERSQPKGDHESKTKELQEKLEEQESKLTEAIKEKEELAKTLETTQQDRAARVIQAQNRRKTIQSERNKLQQHLATINEAQSEDTSQEEKIQQLENEIKEIRFDAELKETAKQSELEKLQTDIQNALEQNRLTLEKLTQAKAKRAELKAMLKQTQATLAEAQLAEWERSEKHAQLMTHIKQQEEEIKVLVNGYESLQHENKKLRHIPEIYHVGSDKSESEEGESMSADYSIRSPAPSSHAFLRVPEDDNASQLSVASSHAFLRVPEDDNASQSNMSVASSNAFVAGSNASGISNAYAGVPNAYVPENDNESQLSVASSHAFVAGSNASGISNAYAGAPSAYAFEDGSAYAPSDASSHAVVGNPLNAGVDAMRSATNRPTKGPSYIPVTANTPPPMPSDPLNDDGKRGSTLSDASTADSEIADESSDLDEQAAKLTHEKRDSINRILSNLASGKELSKEEQSFLARNLEIIFHCARKDTQHKKTFKLLESAVIKFAMDSPDYMYIHYSRLGKAVIAAELGITLKALIDKSSDGSVVQEYGKKLDSKPKEYLLALAHKNPQTMEAVMRKYQYNNNTLQDLYNELKSKVTYSSEFFQTIPGIENVTADLAGKIETFDENELKEFATQMIYVCAMSAIKERLSPTEKSPAISKTEKTNQEVEKNSDKIAKIGKGALGIVTTTLPFLVMLSQIGYNVMPMFGM